MHSSAQRASITCFTVTFSVVPSQNNSRLDIRRMSRFSLHKNKDNVNNSLVTESRWWGSTLHICRSLSSSCSDRKAQLFFLVFLHRDTCCAFRPLTLLGHPSSPYATSYNKITETLPSYQGQGTSFILVISEGFTAVNMKNAVVWGYKTQDDYVNRGFK
jgi:hypothetical protein